MYLARGPCVYRWSDWVPFAVLPIHDVQLQYSRVLTAISQYPASSKWSFESTNLVPLANAVVRLVQSLPLRNSVWAIEAREVNPMGISVSQLKWHVRKLGMGILPSPANESGTHFEGGEWSGVKVGSRVLLLTSEVMRFRSCPGPPVVGHLTSLARLTRLTLV